MNVYQASLEKKQALLTRFVEVGTELFAIAATRADALERLDAEKHAGVIKLADTFCTSSRKRIENNFRGVWRNNDRATYKVAQRVNAGEFAWLEKGGSDIDFR